MSSTSGNGALDHNAATTRDAWSRGRELNPRPIDYESIALPLSYPGALLRGGDAKNGTEYSTGTLTVQSRLCYSWAPAPRGHPR